MNKETALRDAAPVDSSVILRLTESTATPSTCPACAEDPWSWVELLAEAAGAGDRDCARLLPRAVHHAEAEQQWPTANRWRPRP